MLRASVAKSYFHLPPPLQLGAVQEFKRNRRVKGVEVEGGGGGLHWVGGEGGGGNQKLDAGKNETSKRGAHVEM